MKDQTQIYTTLIIFLFFITQIKSQCNVENCMNCKYNVPNYCENCTSDFIAKNGFCDPISVPESQECYVEGCNRCETGSPWYCVECNPPYQKKSGSCIDNKVYEITCNVDKCLECNPSDYCIRCTTNYAPVYGECLYVTYNVQNCRRYDSYGNCIECYPDNELVNGKCYNSGEGYTKKCKDTACVRCYDQTSKNVCMECKIGWYHTGANNCKSCPLVIDHCYTCTNIKTCTVCKDGYRLYAKKSKIECLSCHYACLKCEDYRGCSRCKEGYYLYEHEKYGGYCGECKSHCLVCDNASNCRTCDNTSILINNSCLVKDPNCIIYYPNGNCKQCVERFYPIGSNCYSCIPNCLKCINDNSCEYCDLGYVYRISTHQCVLKDPNCLIYVDGECRRCVEGFYLEDLKCYPCVANCLYCENGEKCLICNDTYFVNKFNICEEKDPNCKIYTDGIGCVACNTGYFLLNDKCYSCLPNCQTCKNGETCEKCNDNYFINSNEVCEIKDENCIEYVDKKGCIECKVGNFLLNYKCIPCISNCDICVEVDKCLSCRENYFINTEETCEIKQDSCLIYEDRLGCKKCKERYFLQNYKCFNCINNCLICEDNEKCEKCDDLYFINKENKCEIKDNNCLEYKNGEGCINCRNGYYLNSSSYCQICGNFCDECEDITGKCKKCTNGYYYDILGNCHQCDDNCIKCENIDKCSLCDENSYYLNLNNDCLVCDNTCSEFSANEVIKMEITKRNGIFTINSKIKFTFKKEIAQFCNLKLMFINYNNELIEGLPLIDYTEKKNNTVIFTIPYYEYKDNIELKAVIKCNDYSMIYEKERIKLYPFQKIKLNLNYNQIPLYENINFTLQANPQPKDRLTTIILNNLGENFTYNSKYELFDFLIKNDTFNISTDILSFAIIFNDDVKINVEETVLLVREYKDYFRYETNWKNNCYFFNSKFTIIINQVNRSNNSIFNLSHITPLLYNAKLRRLYNFTFNFEVNRYYFISDMYFSDFSEEFNNYTLYIAENYNIKLFYEKVENIKFSELYVYTGQYQNSNLFTFFGVSCKLSDFEIIIKNKNKSESKINCNNVNYIENENEDNELECIISNNSITLVNDSKIYLKKDDEEIFLSKLKAFKMFNESSFTFKVVNSSLEVTSDYYLYDLSQINIMNRNNNLTINILSLDSSNQHIYNVKYSMSGNKFTIELPQDCEVFSIENIVSRKGEKKIFDPPNLIRLNRGIKFIDANEKLILLNENTKQVTILLSLLLNASYTKNIFINNESPVFAKNCDINRCNSIIFNSSNKSQIVQITYKNQDIALNTITIHIIYYSYQEDICLDINYNKNYTFIFNLRMYDNFTKDDKVLIEGNLPVSIIYKPFSENSYYQTSFYVKLNKTNNNLYNLTVIYKGEKANKIIPIEFTIEEDIKIKKIISNLKEKSKNQQIKIILENKINNNFYDNALFLKEIKENNPKIVYKQSCSYDNSKTITCNFNLENTTEGYYNLYYQLSCNSTIKYKQIILVEKKCSFGYGIKNNKCIKLRCEEYCFHNSKCVQVNNEEACECSLNYNGFSCDLNDKEALVLIKDIIDSGQDQDIDDYQEKDVKLFKEMNKIFQDNERIIDNITKEEKEIFLVNTIGFMEQMLENYNRLDGKSTKEKIVKIKTNISIKLVFQYIEKLLRMLQNINSEIDSDKIDDQNKTLTNHMKVLLKQFPKLVKNLANDSIKNGSINGYDFNIVNEDNLFYSIIDLSELNIDNFTVNLALKNNYSFVEYDKKNKDYYLSITETSNKLINKAFNLENYSNLVDTSLLNKEGKEENNTLIVNIPLINSSYELLDLNKYNFYKKIGINIYSKQELDCFNSNELKFDITNEYINEYLSIDKSIQTGNYCEFVDIDLKNKYVTLSCLPGKNYYFVGNADKFETKKSMSPFKKSIVCANKKGIQRIGSNLGFYLMLIILLLIVGTLGLIFYKNEIEIFPKLISETKNTTSDKGNENDNKNNNSGIFNCQTSNPNQEKENGKDNVDQIVIYPQSNAIYRNIVLKNDIEIDFNFETIQKEEPIKTQGSDKSLVVTTNQKTETKVKINYMEKIKNFIFNFINNLLNLHPLLFFKSYSKKKPLLLQIWNIIITIILYLNFNYLYLTNNQLNKRIKNKKRNSFIYPLKYESGRLFLTLLSTCVIVTLVKLVGINFYKSKNCEDNNTLNKINLRKIISLILTCVIVIISSVFLIIFGSAFPNTQIGIMFSGFWCLVFNWVVFSNCYILIITLIEGNIKEEVVYYLKELFCF